MKGRQREGISSQATYYYTLSTHAPVGTSQLQAAERRAAYLCFTWCCTGRPCCMRSSAGMRRHSRTQITSSVKRPRPLPPPRATERRHQLWSSPLALGLGHQALRHAEAQGSQRRGREPLEQRAWHANRQAVRAAATAILLLPMLRHPGGVAPLCEFDHHGARALSIGGWWDGAAGLCRARAADGRPGP